MPHLPSLAVAGASVGGAATSGLGVASEADGAVEAAPLDRASTDAAGPAPLADGAGSGEPVYAGVGAGVDRGARSGSDQPSRISRPVAGFQPAPAGSRTTVPDQ